MKIEIDNRNLEAMKKHGEKDYPNECCGFLLGKVENEKKPEVSRFLSDKNQKVDTQMVAKKKKKIKISDLAVNKIISKKGFKLK